jgi:hypothetical protein
MVNIAPSVRKKGLTNRSGLIIVLDFRYSYKDKSAKKHTHVQTDPMNMYMVFYFTP